jgi:hypothetical protein
MFLQMKNPPVYGGFFCQKLFRHCFEALGADFFGDTADFLGLKIYFILPQSFDVGMAHAVSGLGTSAANIADSTHNHEA